MSRLATARLIARQLFNYWRSSLTLRVLVTTTALTVVIVVAVSMVTLTQVRDGLVDQHQRTSLSQAASGLIVAQKAAASLPISTTSTERSAVVDAIVAAVAAPAGTLGSFEVLLLATPEKTPLGAPERGTNLISDSSIPQVMRDAVVSQQSKVWKIAELNFLDGHTEPGLIVGAPLYLDGIGQYELYQLFPMSAEVQTLDITRTSIGWSGLLMVFALTLVSVLLMNQVVRPIRNAAEAAERLRDGRLTERIAVRGQDEIGRLATSFNAMAKSLQDQINRLENLSRMQQRFVSDVSHELRTPLTTIRMASELLYASRDEYDPASARAVELLQQQSERFEALLNDLLEISRLDAGTMKLEIADVDVCAMVNRVIESLALSIHELEVPVIVVASDDLGTVECDARRIERVIRNLIANAIEHARGDRVEVCIARGDAEVAVVVRDHGIGLQPGEAGLVFNRFWRADPSRQRTLGGTGLGLSISLEDTRVHAGWLDADGEPGKGSVFRLVLPLHHGNEVMRSPLPLSLAEVDDWIEAQR
jgi:two-component system sensor histidine kinase MtrB